MPPVHPILPFEPLWPLCRYGHNLIIEGFFNQVITKDLTLALLIPVKHLWCLLVSQGGGFGSASSSIVG